MVKNNKDNNSNKLYSAEDYKIGIVTSEWNMEITESLLNACKTTLNDKGVTEQNITSIKVPGTFELPTGAKMLASSERFDAIICLGCVIKGETKHDDYICNAVANGLTMLGLSSGKPIIFGVVTTNNLEQAQDRAGGKYGNKGEEAALTALSMIELSKSLKSDKKGIGFN